MKIEINEEERRLIEKAVNNLDIMYDFTIDDKEFKESYGLSKRSLTFWARRLNSKVRI